MSRGFSAGARKVGVPRIHFEILIISVRHVSWRPNTSMAISNFLASFAGMVAALRIEVKIEGQYQWLVAQHVAVQDYMIALI